jgi:uncharacterized protein affecting Mg2+/Co2+ transport
MANLEDIPDSITAHICRFVDSVDLIQLRTASTKLLATLATSDEANVIWFLALARDFAFDSETDSLQTLGIHEERHNPSSITSIFGYTLSQEGSVFTAENAFESWKHWSKAAAIFLATSAHKRDMAYKINGPYFLRAAKLWRIIENWGESDESGFFGDTMRNSLVSGVQQNRGRFAKVSNTVTHPFEAIFAFCDGQRLNHQPLAPLFGGYTAYDHTNSMALCSTAEAIERDNPVLISLNRKKNIKSKEILYDVDTAALFVRIGNNDYHEFEVYVLNGEDTNEVGLLWMEEFARRLQNSFLGISSSYQIEDVYNESHYGLSCFPSDRSPLTSRRITKGIEVLASSLGALEIGHVIYSIRLRILTEGEDGYLNANERGFETCQLLSRHWTFYDRNSGETQTVSGDGVIGLHPLLREGGYRNDLNYQGLLREGEGREGIFQYQSCATIDDGTFKGSMKLIPGSIREPSGDPFFVHLGELTLRMIGVTSY